MAAGVVLQFVCVFRISPVEATPPGGKDKETLALVHRRVTGCGSSTDQTPSGLPGLEDSTVQNNDRTMQIKKLKKQGMLCCTGNGNQPLRLGLLGLGLDPIPADIGQKGRDTIMPGCQCITGTT